jgi:hypothetical protein
LASFSPKAALFTAGHVASGKYVESAVIEVFADHRKEATVDGHPEKHVVVATAKFSVTRSLPVYPDESLNDFVNLDAVAIAQMIDVVLIPSKVDRFRHGFIAPL